MISTLSSAVRNLLIFGIRLYQKLLSPLKISRCPFLPSCSEYAVDSLKEYGVFKGFVLAVWRILRCNPFNRGYIDLPRNWADKFRFKTESKS